MCVAIAEMRKESRLEGIKEGEARGEARGRAAAAKEYEAQLTELADLKAEVAKLKAMLA